MNVRDRALQVGGEYNSLILRMADNADSFLRALDASGIESAGDLIESRSAPVRGARAVRGGAQTARAGDRALGGRSDLELRGVLADIHSNLASLNEKQKACEAELSARMDQCRADLMTLEQHSGLRRTYGGRLRDQDARFLDSMR